jgi:H+/Cl- antiporter ClcA
MAGHPIERASTTEGLTVAPSLGPVLEAAQVSAHPTVIDKRVVLLSVMAIGVAIAAGVVAQGLSRLLQLFTNASFFGRLSGGPASPADNALGPWVVLVPAVGGLVVGLMARFWAPGVRGHGIPDAMEKVLTSESRIPIRLTFLKPISAAISIGMGGPFGAEGPVIATGAALGSAFGQVLHTTAHERKTLLAAGAAAGMAASFGCPVAAVLLAIELLLFEYRPRSLIPVALAAAAATGVRVVFVGAHPAFTMPHIVQPTDWALAMYVLIGAIVGLASVGVTRLVYAIEDAFHRLPIHWMWWPAIGGLFVGVVGYIAPHTLGTGYDNIEHALANEMAPSAIALLCTLKLASWSVSLGSGTSGGTLAPLFTLGSGLGAVLGAAAVALAPRLGVDPRIAALVGMAAIFAGASRALLASVVFAFETTRRPIGLLPLLGGCTSAFMVSCLLMRTSIMTEQMARKGVRALGEYTTDYLAQLGVGELATRPVVTLGAEDGVTAVRGWLASDAPGTEHQGFPVVDRDGHLVGVITRRDIAAAPEGPLAALVARPAVVVYDDSSLRDAADRMALEDIGRLPVVTRAAPRTVVGILTRSDLVNAHRRRLREECSS